MFLTTPFTYCTFKESSGNFRQNYSHFGCTFWNDNGPKTDKFKDIKKHNLVRTALKLFPCIQCSQFDFDSLYWVIVYKEWL